MKKTLIILTALMLTLNMTAQEYTANNGVTYQIGDTITLGDGTKPDGSFKYVQYWGAKLMMLQDLNNPESIFANRDYSGFDFVIKKFKKVRVAGREVMYFILDGSLAVSVELAIKTGEIQ